MFKMPSLRIVDFLGFLACVFLVILAVALEIYIKLQPCPLCVIQRAIYIILALLFLVGAFIPWRQTGQKIYHLIIFAVAFVGLAIAARHVYITLLPPWRVPACGGSLKYLFNVLPANQAIMVLFQGTGDCAKVTWRFLGLSIPEWSLISFIFFSGLCFWQAFRKPN